MKDQYNELVKGERLESLIPQKGSWILIRQLIPVEIPIDPLSIYYATPTGTNFIDYEDHSGSYEVDLEHKLERISMDTGHARDIIFRYYAGKKVKEKHALELQNNPIHIEQQVSILTKWGEVSIQPHEYTKLKDVGKYLDAVNIGHATVHYLTNKGGLKGKIRDQVFYMQSRGVSYGDALQMVAGNITTKHLLYITMHEEYQRMFTRYYDQYAAKKKAFLSKYKN